MKQKVYTSLAVAVVIAIAILIRPQVARMTSPSSQWMLEPTTDYPNGLMAAGSGFGINANLLGGYSQSAFQRKIITKHVSFGPSTTTALSPPSMDDLSGAAVTFTSQEISGQTTLIVMWGGSFNNNVVGNGIQTRLYLDGNDTYQVSHIGQNSPSDTWTQHAANAVFSVPAGSHTLSLKWVQFYGGGLASVSSNGYLTVIAIPE